MSSNTTNLNLYKADPVADANNTFNIKTMLNDNWDKIDTAVIAKFLEAKGYTDTKIQQLINSAPGALDTLKELADALGDDSNFSATMTNALALKAPLASPTLTGTPSAPTPAADTNTTQIATTAFVLGQAGATTPNMDGVATTGTSNKYARADHVHPSDATKANVASPILTGTPSAPTPAADTNTTQIATTAFVLGQAGTTTPQMDGAGAAGTSNKYARADHVHPSDATKANVASPTFTGTVKTTNNTLDDGSGNMSAAGMITSKNGVKVNNQSTATLNSQLLGVPTAGYFMSGTSVGDTVLRNETNSNISFGFAGASGAENPALKLTYNATGASKVSTQRNTLDDGSGNVIMSNGVLGGNQSNFHVVPTNGGNVGFTNNARNKWGLMVADNASGNPKAFTNSNTLDDGNGGMTVGGLTVNSNAQINGSLYFKANMDNSDTITLSKNNVASNVSSLDITVGDDGSGAAITAPSSGSTDYVSIKSTNVGIHHLFGSDGTYKAATSVSAPTLTSTAGTGTAPLAVASTTMVSNLNADMLDGWQGSDFVNKWGYQTTSSGTTYTGQYTKIASVNITSQYQDTGVTLAFKSLSNAVIDSSGTLMFRVRQQNVMASAPWVDIKLFGNSSYLNTSNFVAVTTVNTASQTVVELYYKAQATWDSIMFTPVTQYSAYMTFYSSQSFLSSLPSGTQTACTQLAWNGDLNVTGKLSTTNNTLDDGSGNMTVGNITAGGQVKANAFISGTQYLNMAPASGGQIGFTNNARSKWGLMVYDNPTGSPQTFTVNNTLDDGNGNAKFGGAVGIGNSNEIWGINSSGRLWINYRGYDGTNTNYFADTYIGNGKGAALLTTKGSTGAVTTKNNTLDDGGGRMSIPYPTSGNGIVVGSTNDLNSHVFGLSVSTPVGAGIWPFGVVVGGGTNGKVALSVNSSGTLGSLYNVLDDSNGNTIISGNAYINSGVVAIKSSGGYPNLQFRNSSDVVKQQIITDTGSGHMYLDASGSFVFRSAPNGATAIMTLTNAGALTTKNNTLDDGSGGMVVNGPLYFKPPNDNTDTMYITKTDVSNDLSLLDIVIGDNGTGTTIATPPNSTLDYLSIKSSNFGIHHLFGSDGSYVAASSIKTSKFLAGESPTTAGGYSFYADGAQDTGMFSPSDGVLDFYCNGNKSLHMDASTLQFNGNTICHTGNEPSSQAQNGYKKFADGTIIQWGKFVVSANAATSITFPIAFPNVNLVAVANPDVAGITSATAQVSYASKTGMTLYSNIGCLIDWIAIGC